MIVSMSVVRTTTLAVLTVLIALTVLVGQAAFRMDRTLLRHDFVHLRIDSWFEPLAEPGNHEQFVGALLNEITRGLDWRVPVQVQAVVREAAASTFSAEWLVSFVKRTHTTAYRLMRGDAEPVRITLPFGRFFNEIVGRARAELPAETATALAAELSRAPASIDLWAEIDAETRSSVEGWLRRVPVVSLLLQYVLPGVFIALTLVFRRPGSAMVASGAGLSLGGALMLVVIASYRDAVGQAAGRAMRAVVPGGPGWIQAPVAATVEEAISTGSDFAIFLVALGVVIALLGVLVIRRWADSFEPLVRAAR